MISKVFNEENELLPFKPIIYVVCLALAFRSSILVLNLYLDNSPTWGFLPRTAIAIAWSDFGRLLLPENFESLYGTTLEASLKTWYLNDRGLTILYVLIDKAFGHVTYFQIQVFQLIIDSLMVLPAMGVAKRVAGPTGAIVAGVAYALFLPQAQMTVSPDYNGWLGCAMITMIWIAVLLIEARKAGIILCLFSALVIVNFIGNEFRSVVALFSFGAAGWFWLVSIGAQRSLLLPKYRWKKIGMFVAAGMFVFMITSSINYISRGEISPIRSSLGHAFFTGVGQYPNPLGMTDLDSAPADWYVRETGVTDINYSLNTEYNEWLMERAKEFVSDYPVLYASMVVRRAWRILFPNMAFTVVTDILSYARSPRQLELAEMRKSLVAEHGWLSVTALTTILKADPAYIFGLCWRVLLLIILPIGLFSAIWLSRSRGAAVFATLPLAYGIITLSFVYVTPPVVTGIHAAVLPVSAAGLFLLFCRAKEMYSS